MKMWATFMVWRLAWSKFRFDEVGDDDGLWIRLCFGLYWKIEER